MPQIMQHRYVRRPPLPRQSSGLFHRRSSSSSSSIATFQTEMIAEMQRRYESSMASKRRCTVAISSRGTADAAGASRSGSQSSPAASREGERRGAASAQSSSYDAHSRSTVRSRYDSADDAPPEMSAAMAASATGGFMANGDPTNVVKALERELFKMGAEVRLRNLRCLCLPLSHSCRITSAPTKYENPSQCNFRECHVFTNQRRFPALP